MKLYSTAHGSKWHAVVVEGAVVVRICRDVGCHVRLPEEIQGKYDLWYQLVPLMDWEVVGYAGQDRNEMALVSLNRPLRNVSPVHFRWCFLNATTIYSNCF